MGSVSSVPVREHCQAQDEHRQHGVGDHRHLGPDCCCVHGRHCGHHVVLLRGGREREEGLEGQELVLHHIRRYKRFLSASSHFSYKGGANFSKPHHRKVISSPKFPKFPKLIKQFKSFLCFFHCFQFKLCSCN